VLSIHSGSKAPIVDTKLTINKKSKINAKYLLGRVGTPSGVSDAFVLINTRKSTTAMADQTSKTGCEPALT
jgi:hypothetical protein